MHDTVTPQEMICNNKNSQGSIQLKPSALFKILEPCTPEQINNIINIPEITSQKNIEIDDVNQNAGVKRSIEIDNLAIDKKHTVNELPEVIFNAASYKRHNSDFHKLISGNNVKRYNRVNKLRKIHFKFKNTNNTLSRTVKNYNKYKQNEIKKSSSQNLSKVVTRYKILKKVFAKEKLIDDHILLSKEFRVNFLNTRSFSKLSKTRKILPSLSSRNVLTPNKTLSCSIPDVYYNINSKNSIIQILSDKCIPYKMDIINVAVAVAYNKSAESNKVTITPSKDKYILFRDSLTSTETMTIPSVAITSKPHSTETLNGEDNLDRYINTRNKLSDASNQTLVNVESIQKSYISSDHDTFFIARTSSDFNKSNFSSNYTVTSISTNEILSDNESPNDNENVKRNFNLDNTVINMEILADTTPSTSSAVKHNKEFNDVIIDKPLKTYFDDKNKGDDSYMTNQKDFTSNVLTKPFNIEKDINYLKTLNLPNESTIKWQLENERDSLKFVSEECKSGYPTNFSDMWDKFILLLDKSIKRVEETLAEKISKELKKFIDILDQYKNPDILLSTKIEGESFKSKENKCMSNKEVSVDELKFQTNERVQCDLVEKSIIDELMISFERPKSEAPVYTKSIDRLKDKFFKYYLDVLRTPIADSHEDVRNPVPASAATSELDEDIQRFHWLKDVFKIPVQFFRENAFVITSVPTFLAILLFVYGLVLLVIKP